MYQDLISSLDYNIKAINNVLNKKDKYNSLLHISSNEKSKIERELNTLSETRDLYTNAVDIIYQESIGALQDTLHTALQYIMTDKNYSVNLILENKRGVKTLDIAITDLDEGFEVGISDGCGQGVRTIVSFVLKMYYLLNKGSNILLLDEKYSALSEHYIPRFMEFIKEMCETKGLIVVMITHDQRFMPYADKAYSVNDGYVSILEETESATVPIND